MSPSAFKLVDMHALQVSPRDLSADSTALGSDRTMSELDYPFSRLFQRPRRTALLPDLHIARDLNPRRLFELDTGLRFPEAGTWRGSALLVLSLPSATVSPNSKPLVARESSLLCLHCMPFALSGC